MNKLWHLETRIAALKNLRSDKSPHEQLYIWHKWNSLKIIGNLIKQNKIIFYSPEVFPKRVKKWNFLYVYIYGKAVKQVIKFIQLFCHYSHFNVIVHIILNIFLEISFEHHFDQLLLWFISLEFCLPQKNYELLLLLWESKLLLIGGHFFP